MDSFNALVVRKNEDNSVSAGMEQVTLNDLPKGEVLIRAQFSSINYKDALAISGHPGVVRNFPHVPGIDIAGVVEESTSSQFQTGDEVLVTGYGFGSDQWGGYSEFARVPSAWVVPLPKGLTAAEAMTFGTAGFTAAQSVAAIVEHNIKPEDGEIVVSGASGGVGSIAVGILAKLGYHVVASTGKKEKNQFLKELGAKEIIGREALNDTSNRPLLSSRWTAGVDTVGGNTLTTILRSTKHRACITACGLVGGVDLPLTVHPFILRGAILVGIDSAKCPIERRLEIWRRLSEEWKIPGLAQLAQQVKIENIIGVASKMLAGQGHGRPVVEIG